VPSAMSVWHINSEQTCFQIMMLCHGRRNHNSDNAPVYDLHRPMAEPEVTDVTAE
jgi:hypothetical protein